MSKSPNAHGRHAKSIETIKKQCEELGVHFSVPAKGLLDVGRAVITSATMEITYHMGFTGASWFIANGIGIYAPLKYHSNMMPETDPTLDFVRPEDPIHNVMMDFFFEPKEGEG